MMPRESTIDAALVLGMLAAIIAVALWSQS